MTFDKNQHFLWCFSTLCIYHPFTGFINDYLALLENTTLKCHFVQIFENQCRKLINQSYLFVTVQ